MKKISILFLIINNQAMYNNNKLHKKDNKSTNTIQNLEKAKQTKEIKEKQLEKARQSTIQAREEIVKNLINLYDEKLNEIHAIINILKDNTTHEIAQKKIIKASGNFMKSLEVARTLESEHLKCNEINIEEESSKEIKSFIPESEIKQITSTPKTNKLFHVDSTSSFPEE